MSEQLQLKVTNAQVRMSDIDEERPTVRQVSINVTDETIGNFTVKPRKENTVEKTVDGIKGEDTEHVELTVSELKEKHPNLYDIVEKAQGSDESLLVDVELSQFYSEERNETYYYVDRSHIEKMSVVG